MADKIDDQQVFRSRWYDRTVKGSDDDLEKCSSNSSSSSSSSFGAESMVSNGSLSESDDNTTDDASSSFSSNNSNGSLYDLSEIMAQLPIKRGLSKFYQGKSESFTSLSRVTSIEDLAKKKPPFRKNFKASKSCGNGLNRYKPYSVPNSAPKKSMTGS